MYFVRAQSPSQPAAHTYILTTYTDTAVDSYMRAAVAVEALHLQRSFHGANPDAGLAFKAQLRFNHCAVLDKPYGGTRAQINTTAAANTLFSVDSYHV